MEQIEDIILKNFGDDLTVEDYEEALKEVDDSLK